MMVWVKRMIFVAICVMAGPGTGGLGVEAGKDRKPRASLQWTFFENGLRIAGWGTRLVLFGPDRGWIGAARRPARDGRETLYVLRNGRWSVDSGFPIVGERAFVLDVDAKGNLWVCNFDPGEESTYEGLRIDFYNGREWTHRVVDPGIWPQAMDMISPEEGWIGGNHGYLLHFDGGQWKKEKLPRSETDTNVMDLKMVDSREGWLVGTKGLAAHYQNGSWRVLDVPDWVAANHLRAVDIAPDGRVFFAGAKGMIGYYDGKSWSRQPTGTTVQLESVKMISNDDGWAVGHMGTILRFDGGRWEPQPSPTFKNLTDLEMVSETEGWIVGEGIILKAQERRDALFLNVSGSESLPMTRDNANSAVSIDLDRDGFLDIMTLREDGIHFYKNRGDGSFAETALELEPRPSFGFGLIEAFAPGDVDGDGKIDLFLIGQDRRGLYLNRGGLRFIDVTEAAGLIHQWGWNHSVHFVDLDLDGDLDLYIARSGTGEFDNVLYHNDGSGRFTLKDQKTGGKGIEHMVLWGDLNGDFFPDLIMGGYSGREFSLLLNNGSGLFEDHTEASGIPENLGEGVFSQGQLVDRDLDGDLDLLMGGDRFYFFTNDGSGRFILKNPNLLEKMRFDPEHNTQLANMADLDHEGGSDLILYRRYKGDESLRLFLGNGPEAYRETAREYGLSRLFGDFGLFSDWDEDGDLDLFLGNPGDLSFFMKNEKNDDRFLKVGLHGIRSNRMAIGARVSVYDGGHLGESDRLRGHVQAGMGLNYEGRYNYEVVHFGLDSEKRYDLKIEYPGGRAIVRKNIRAGVRLDIPEYSGIKAMFYRAVSFLGRIDGNLVQTESLRLALLIVLLTGTGALLRARYGFSILLDDHRMRILLFMCFTLMFLSRIYLEHPLLNRSFPFAVQIVLTFLIVALPAAIDWRLVVLRKRPPLTPLRAGEEWMSSETAILSGRVKTLEALLEVGKQIATIDSDTALDLILCHMMRITGAERGAIALLEDDGRIHFKHGINLDIRELNGTAHPGICSVVRDVVRGGKLLVIESSRGSAKPVPTGLGSPHSRGVLAVPLKTARRVLGVIYVDARTGEHGISSRDAEVFDAFGAYAAVTLENAGLYSRLRNDYERLRRSWDRAHSFEGIVYQSAAMDRICQAVEQIRNTEITVLIQGETGTGKELVAQAVHVRSNRRKGPWMCLNVGALPDTILESELFGHRRGAFSGAVENKIGLFEAAHGGTVFLDEIGEASPGVQVRLLRFLETGAFRRVGEVRDRTANVRIIAATNRNLKEEIRHGNFREDLFFRLSVFVLRLPPLRERREDIPALVHHFIQIYNRKLGKSVGSVSRETLSWLTKRGWEGNVRELANTLYRLMVVSSGDRLAEPGECALTATDDNVAPATLSANHLKSLNEIERDYIRHVIQATSGNQTEAARVLGLHRNTLRSRMQKLGLLP